MASTNSGGVMDLDLTHVRLLVQDYVSCYRFYRDVLGLKPRFKEENGVYEEFDAGNVMLALFKRELMADVVTSVPRPLHRSDQVVLCFNVANVDECHRQLTSQGVTFETPPHDQPNWMIRVAHLRDPDGNLIEINQPLEE
jgi:lactoylglutathione lyase